MRLRSFIGLIFGFFVALMVVDSPMASAAGGPWAENDHGRLRLISVGETIAPSDVEGLEVGEGEVLLGLHFQLEPDWKIYWRSPGDAGFPPSLNWEASENIDDLQMEWPAPKRFSLFGLETFGYGEEVVFPVVASLVEHGGAISVKASVNYLTCSDICVPYDEVVSLTLPTDSGLSTSGSSSAEQAALSYYRAKVPQGAAASDISLEASYLEGMPGKANIHVELASAVPFDELDLMVEGPPGFFFAKPEITFKDEGRSAVMKVAVGRSSTAGVLEGKRLTFTVVDGPRALEDQALVRFAYPGAAMAAFYNTCLDLRGQQREKSPTGLLTMLGFALLGGLILNLMPCVLPVLSLKLLSVVKQGGRSRGAIRGSFIASAAGIISSFLLLAAAAVGVKATGFAVGWGVQFQQPLFLVFMALLLTFFAANLFGFFEILLPGGLSTQLAKQPGDGPLGSFLTGAFATLLATPCSAPFLGTAVAFALSRGASEIFLIFLFLGIGLSLPYLAVALWPGMASRLPKPGKWMAHLRTFLGLALAGTAIWLLTVLASQVGMFASALVGALLGLILLLIALRRPRAAASRPSEKRGAESAWRRVALGVVPVLALMAFFVPVSVGSPPPMTVDRGDWPVLDVAAIHQEVAAGNTVFVDVTADWCITCQVNKKLVLDDPVVSERLSSNGVSLQRGDWTLPSDQITNYLASFERYGIPFNVVYGPGAPEGVPLPELLSVQSVLEALDEAGGKAVN